MPGPAGPGVLGHPSKGLKGRYTSGQFGQTLPEGGPNGAIECADPSGLIHIIERYCALT